MQISRLAGVAAWLGALTVSVTADSFPYNRLNANDSALLIVDHQVGLFPYNRDWDPVVFENALLAHASIGKLFDLPVVLTTSYETGPNGPLPIEITNMYPDVKVISRPGEVNAWDNPDFRAAVKATGKSQLVIGGIAADVCTTFLALSLRAEGYAVFANADASATYSLRAAQDANDRMRAHGVEILSWFAVISELFRDWRNPSPNVTTVINEMNKYFPIGGWVGRQHAAAILDGKLLPGEGSLVGQ